MKMLLRTSHSGLEFIYVFFRQKRSSPICLLDKVVVGGGRVGGLVGGEVGLTLLHSDKLTSHHEKASHSSGLVSMATVMRVHHQERRKTEMVVKPLRM